MVKPYRYANRPGAATDARVLPIAAFVALFAALPYLIGGVSRSFILLDDPDYVGQNSHVRRGLTLAGVRWALTSFDASNWFPATWVSHMIDVSLFGLDPRGHHLTSIALHALAAVLLFVALLRLTGALWPSAAVSVLFGVHPLHVESVAWVSERKDVLAGVFFALVLLAYERYARHGGAARYFLVALLLGLGLMAKPMLVTVPFLLLLLDFWPLGRAGAARTAARQLGPARAWGMAIAEKLPLLALSCAASVFTFQAQRSGAAVVDTTFLSPGVRLAHAVVSLTAYLDKTLWPRALAIYYPHPLAAPVWWKFWGALLLLAAISAGAGAQLHRRPYIAVGWLWFVGMLVPVIGLIQVGEQALADRYTYLPHIGLFMLPAWGLSELLRRLPRLAAGLCTISVATLALLAAASAAQVGLWQDGETVFRHALSVTSANWKIRYCLGLELAEKNRPDEALENFRETLRIRPNQPDAHNNIGIILAGQGRTEEALGHLREALRLRPDHAETHTNIGSILAGQGRVDEALGHLREALRLKPDFAKGRNNLANTLLMSGRLDEAIVNYREALRLQPDFAMAHANLGLTLTKQGRLADAAAEYREVLRLQPGSVEARLRLDGVLEGLAREAAAHPAEAATMKARSGQRAGFSNPVAAE